MRKKKENIYENRFLINLIFIIIILVMTSTITVASNISYSTNINNNVNIIIQNNDISNPSVRSIISLYPSSDKISEISPNLTVDIMTDSLSQERGNILYDNKTLKSNPNDTNFEVSNVQESNFIQKIIYWVRGLFK